MPYKCTIIIFTNNILGISNQEAVQTQERDRERQAGGGRLQEGQGLFYLVFEFMEHDWMGLIDPGLLLSASFTYLYISDYIV